MIPTLIPRPCNNEYVKIFDELLNLKSGSDVFGPLPPPRQSGGVFRSVTSILISREQPEPENARQRPIHKVIHWNELLLHHYSKNTHNADQLLKLQAVARRILLSEKVTIIEQELEKRGEDKEIIKSELQRLKEMIRIIWEAPTVNVSAPVARSPFSISRPIKIRSNAPEVSLDPITFWPAFSPLNAVFSYKPSPRLAERRVEEAPAALRIKRTTSAPYLTAPTISHDIPQESAPQALSLEDEHKLLSLNYQIKSDSLDEARERKAMEKKAAQEFKTLLPANYNDWKERILDYVSAIKNPEEIKVIGRAASKLQAMEIFQFALGNENIASKFLYFLGSLSFEVLQDVLASFRPEDRERLEQLNRCLRTHRIKALKEPGSKKLMIFCPHPQEEVHEIPVDITKDVHKWYEDVCYEEETSKQFLAFVNPQKQRIDELANRFRYRWHNLQADDLKIASDLKNFLQLHWQVALNYSVLVHGLVKEQKTMHDIDKEYAIYIARLSRHWKKDNASAPLNMSTLLEMMKKNNEMLKELQKKLEQKEKYDEECKSLLQTAIEEGAKIEVLIKNVSESPGGSLFAIVEHEILTTFIPEITDIYTQETFKTDEAYYFLEQQNVFSLENLKKAGLLQNVPPEEYDKSKDCREKILCHAKRNLYHLGLKTLEDLFERFIYNPYLLQAYLQKPEVQAILRQHPLIFDPFKSLERYGLNTLEEYREIGLLTNVPDAVYDIPIEEGIRTRLYERIFNHAKENLALLDVDKPTSFLSHNDKNKDILRRFLSYPQVQEMLKQHPFKLEN